MTKILGDLVAFLQLSDLSELIAISLIVIALLSIVNLIRGK